MNCSKNKLGNSSPINLFLNIQTRSTRITLNSASPYWLLLSRFFKVGRILYCNCNFAPTGCAKAALCKWWDTKKAGTFSYPTAKERSFFRSLAVFQVGPTAKADFPLLLLRIWLCCLHLFVPHFYLVFCTLKRSIWYWAKCQSPWCLSLSGKY